MPGKTALDLTLEHRFVEVLLVPQGRGASIWREERGNAKRYLFRLRIAALLAGLFIGGRPASAGTTAGHEVRKVGYKMVKSDHKMAWGYHRKRANAKRRHEHRAKPRMRAKKAFGYQRKAARHASQAK